MVSIGVKILDKSHKLSKNRDFFADYTNLRKESLIMMDFMEEVCADEFEIIRT